MNQSKSDQTQDSWTVSLFTLGKYVPSVFHVLDSEMSSFERMNVDLL